MPKKELTANTATRFRLRRAADFLGVRPSTLASRAWRSKHSIPAYRIGRALVFDPAALDLWLAMHAERRSDEAER